MISSGYDTLYSPFLNWNRDDPITVDSVSQAVVSLVSMVRDGYQFDEKLLQNTSTLLSSIRQNLCDPDDFEALLKAVGQDSTDPSAGFLDSMIMFMSSSHPSIFRDALTLVGLCLYSYPLSHCLTLVSSKLIPRIFSTPHLRDLSVIDNNGILHDIIQVLQRIFGLTETTTLRSISARSGIDPQSIRDVVLHEVFIPIEPSLVQISSNRHLPSWEDESRDTFILLLRIFEVSAFHQPTLDFICSSHIPMAFQSLLSRVEHEDARQFAVWSIPEIINTCKRYGAESLDRIRILLQILEREGFRNHLEQTLLHDKASMEGKFVGVYSFEIMKLLGMNSPRLE
ncbi:hypothetical protein BLNAU_10254 [Blattamonas nauphoetae]|uniref:Uncharacterized protein n=1 Tax=Blattamonas nauphoetae TaxID=2049346 RepID=A0ABQ9XTH6_9EUKA|nr:hypothetical protein BLNAU_10254 [Blattamonas nauphoetae]